MTADIPDYLIPYHDAARRHRGGFGSLLWASRWTQHLRFRAIAAAFDLAGRSVLDVGCGLGDFYSFLLESGTLPSVYVGIEPVARLASYAREQTGQTIIEADVVENPSALAPGADVLVFSGTLNTIDDGRCQQLLRHAMAATRAALIFNFLDGPKLANASHLYARQATEMVRFCRTLHGAGELRLISGYLDGDATIVLHKGGADDTTPASTYDPPPR